MIHLFDLAYESYQTTKFNKYCKMLNFKYHIVYAVVYLKLSFKAGFLKLWVA